MKWDFLKSSDADAGGEEHCPYYRRVRRDPLTLAVLSLRYYLHKARGLFLVGDYQDALDVFIHSVVPALSVAASAAGCEYDAFFELKLLRDALRELKHVEPFAARKRVYFSPFCRAIQMLEPPGAPDAPLSAETILALIRDLNMGEPVIDLAPGDGTPAGQPQTAA